MKTGTHKPIASVIKISPGMVGHLIKGIRNASGPIADKLADLTNTDIRIWLKSATLKKHLSNVEARRQAVTAWAEGQERASKDEQTGS